MGVSFSDNMNIAFTDETRLYIAAEAISATILLVSLILYFLSPKRTMMAIHGLSVTAIFIIEMLIDQSQLRTFSLYAIGIMLWLSIDNLPFLTNLIISRRLRAIHGNE